MEAIILTKEQYFDIQEKLQQITELLNEKQKNPKEIFLDNQEFLQTMNISKRTAQNWRDQGIISFSQIGSKIYYKMSDIEELLERTKVKSFK
jgi:hypothetical protein